MSGQRAQPGAVIAAATAAVLAVAAVLYLVWAGRPERLAAGDGDAVTGPETAAAPADGGPTTERPGAAPPAPPAPAAAKATSDGGGPTPPERDPAARPPAGLPPARGAERTEPLPLLASGAIDFAALGLTGKEPGAELLRTEERVREAPLEPDFRVGQSWTVETYYRATQVGEGDHWSDPVLWRFEIAREDVFEGEPCLVFEVAMLDPASGAAAAAPGAEPATFYVSQERYDLLGARLSAKQGGKVSEHTIAYARSPAGSAAGGTIIPFDLPARGACARVVAPGRELPRLEPVSERDRARFPEPGALVGGADDALLVEIISPQDGTLVRQRWAPSDRRWPVESVGEHRRSYRRR